MAAVRPTTKRHFSFKVGQRVPQPEEALDTLVARWRNLDAAFADVLEGKLRALKKTVREHDALEEAESKVETDKLDALERVLAFSRKIEQTKQEITEEERRYHDLLAREEANTLLARSLVSFPPSSSVSSSEPLELRVARLRRLQVILGDLRSANSRLSALI